MKHFRSRHVWTTVVLFFIACSSTPTGPRPGLEQCVVDVAPGGNGVRVLFIGNSLTFWNDVPSVLAGLLTEANVPYAEIEMQAFPNFGLEDHWGTQSTRELIAEGWDIVVMQQGPSATEGRPSLLAFSQLFADEIRANGGEPALFMVWPDVSRFFDFDGVSDSYATAAEMVNGYLYPAGEAWRAAWDRDPTLLLYDSDGFHPSRMGSYLAALVMFEQIATMSPSTLPASFCQPGTGIIEIPNEVADLLQAAAAEANVEFARDLTP